jgi:uncharacterized membrane protein (UPF0127 family)
VSPRSGSTLRATVTVLVVALIVLAGCSSGSDTGSASDSPSSSATTAVAPELAAPEGFRTVTVTVTRPDGSTEEWCLWLADDPELRAKGLMFVTDPDLGGAPGILFWYPEDTRGDFWMRNTLLPLSIAWYDGAGGLVSSTDMAPCPDGGTDCPHYASAGPYRYAIEVPQGELDDLGLIDGSTIALGGHCSVGEV